MNSPGPRSTPAPECIECQQPDAPLEGRPGQILVVCLDSAHRDTIARRVSPALCAMTCPFRILRLLDGDLCQQVILDRCPASFECCRRHSVALQRLIRRGAHPPRSLPEFGEGDEGKTLSDKVREICERFRGSAQRVTLPAVAAAFGVSPRHLNRVFHAAGADSPMRVVRREWLRQASELIHTTSRSIEVIADDHGYYDRACFARAFRRVFGFYPGRLRRPLS